MTKFSKKAKKPEFQKSEEVENLQCLAEAALNRANIRLTEIVDRIKEKVKNGTDQTTDKPVLPKVVR